MLKQVFVINLDRRPDRMNEFIERCPKELDYQRFSAIDGQLLDTCIHYNKGIPESHAYTDSIYKFKRKKRIFGENGCYQSHYNIWKKVLDINTIDERDMVMILEDDLFFTENFLKKLNTMLNEFHSLNESNPNTFIYIAGRFTPDFKPSNTILLEWKQKSSMLYERPHHTNLPGIYKDRTTTGYILTKAMIRNLIENTYMINEIDKELEHYLTLQSNTIKVYDCFPHLGWSPINYKSDIQF